MKTEFRMIDGKQLWDYWVPTHAKHVMKKEFNPTCLKCYYEAQEYVPPPPEPIKCKHHWVIETPEGEFSSGECKLCHETKMFRNSTDDYCTWTESTAFVRDVTRPVHGLAS